MNIFSFSRPSRLLMHYGFYAVLCHSTAILFTARTSPLATGIVNFHRFFPMLEASLISFVIVLVGVLGLEYIARSK